jgi:hypothetical protein
METTNASADLSWPSLRREDWLTLEEVVPVGVGDKWAFANVLLDDTERSLAEGSGILIRGRFERGRGIARVSLNDMVKTELFNVVEGSGNRCGQQFTGEIFRAKVKCHVI